MIYRINKGAHRALPPSFGLWYNKKYVCKRVRFAHSCAYDFGTIDQLDSNKLFGIGYLWHHHKDSARIGWRYRPEWDKIELIAYCYVDGERVNKPFYEVALNEPVILRIAVRERHYVFNVRNKDGVLKASVSIPFNHSKKWGYPLGVFFGGNNPAPHRMEVEISNYNG